MWKYAVNGDKTYLVSPDNVFSVEFITSDSLLYALKSADKVFKEEYGVLDIESYKWSYTAPSPYLDSNLERYSSLVNQYSSSNGIINAYVGYLIHNTTDPRKTLGAYYTVMGNLSTHDYEESINLNYTFHYLKQSFDITTTLRQALNSRLQAPELYIPNLQYPGAVWFEVEAEVPGVLDLPAVAVCRYFEDFTTIGTPESIMSHYISTTQGTAE